MFVSLVESLREQGTAHPALAAFVAATAATVVLLLVFTHNPLAKSHYPYVGVDSNHRVFKGIRQRVHWFKHGPQLIHSSFKKFPNAIFTLPSLDRTSIVLPPRNLQEIRDLPREIASNSHATSDVRSPQPAVLSFKSFPNV